MAKVLSLDLGRAELPDRPTDRGVEPEEQDQPPTLRRGDGARLVLEREDGREVESSRVEGPMPGVGQALVARSLDPGAERIGRRIAGGSRVKDRDRRLEFVDLRRGVGVQEHQADAGQQLVLVVRQVARERGHDVLDVRQDDVDDVAGCRRRHVTSLPLAPGPQGRDCRIAATGRPLDCRSE